jgi:hypothetical protein
LFLGQSYALDKDWVLRFEIDQREQEHTTLLRLQRYF